MPLYGKLASACGARDGEYAAHIMEKILVYAENRVKDALAYGDDNAQVSLAAFPHRRLVRHIGQGRRAEQHDRTLAAPGAVATRNSPAGAHRPIGNRRTVTGDKERVVRALL
jgi:hypothetical protein